VSSIEGVGKEPGHEASQVDKMLLPLNTIVQQKLTKHYSSVLGIFQSLAASGYLSFYQVIGFLDIADLLLDSDDMILIKLIQVLLIVTTRESLSAQPMANKVLAFSLKVFSTREPIIKNNILAVLRQLHSLLFEQYTQHQTKNLEDICYEQLNQLITIVGDKSKPMNIKCLGIDLITLILVEARKVLKSSKQLNKLLRKDYVPLLENYLINEAGTFVVLMRSIKSVTQLLITLQSSYDVLQPVLNLANSSHSWQRYLALESFCTLFSDYRQIQLLNDAIRLSTNLPVLLNIHIDSQRHNKRNKHY